MTSDDDLSSIGSDEGCRYIRYEQKTSSLKWKRMYVRGRERDRLRDLADLDMPLGKKQRLIREVIYYSSVSSHQPIRNLSVYDYTSEAESPAARSSMSYEFRKSSRDGSSAVAETSVEATGSNSDGTERCTTTTTRSSEPVESSAVADESTSRLSEADSSLNEEELESTKGSIASGQYSPERTRRSEDAAILSLSPALSALKITDKTCPVLEAEERIEDTVKNPNVRFFKCGYLYTHMEHEFLYTIMYDAECSGRELTSCEPAACAAPPRLLLVPSNLRVEVRRMVLKFAEQFDCPIAECQSSEGSFDERVSHVLIDLGLPDSLDFAQYQAIGCKRFLVSEEWLLDSLKAGRIISEEPHELAFVDEDTGESIAASRLARQSPNNLFHGYAFIMCPPFDNFKVPLLTQLLSMNGARICTHPRELSDVPGQARLCIVDPKFYLKGKKRELLKLKSTGYKFVAVQYAWLFDSLLVYQVQPLLEYLYDADAQLALRAGVPRELLEE